MVSLLKTPTVVIAALALHIVLLTSCGRVEGYPREALGGYEFFYSPPYSPLPAPAFIPDPPEIQPAPSAPFVYQNFIPYPRPAIRQPLAICCGGTGAPPPAFPIRNIKIHRGYPDTGVGRSEGWDNPEGGRLQGGTFMLNPSLINRPRGDSNNDNSTSV